MVVDAEGGRSAGGGASVLVPDTTGERLGSAEVRVSVVVVAAGAGVPVLDVWLAAVDVADRRLAVTFIPPGLSGIPRLDWRAGVSFGVRTAEAEAGSVLVGGEVLLGVAISLVMAGVGASGAVPVWSVGVVRAEAPAMVAPGV
jgi:hypothetical protein